MKAFRLGWKIVSIWLLVSCSVTRETTGRVNPTDIDTLHFLNEFVIPYNLQFQGTTVGGLSGIDYDQKNNQYYLVSDDRSEINPARFYTAKVLLNEKGIDSVYFTKVTSLLRATGQVYPNSKQDPYLTPDTEGLRYSTKRKQLIISSEGERIIRSDKQVLANPFINWVDLNGQARDSFELSPQIRMYKEEKGLRQNSVLEGLTFADNDSSLYVSIEEPLYDDGSRASNTDSAWIRILKYDLSTRKPTAQYGYRIDPVPYPSTPAGKYVINGVPDILYLSNNRLLVVERSYSTGRPYNSIRIYIADLSQATNVINIASLQNAAFQSASKRLVMNMDDLNIPIFNIEGVCFGPTLKNGHQTLLFVSDNNFDEKQRTAFYLFEIISSSKQ